MIYSNIMLNITRIKIFFNIYIRGKKEFQPFLFIRTFHPLIMTNSRFNYLFLRWAIKSTPTAMYWYHKYEEEFVFIVVHRRILPFLPHPNIPPVNDVVQNSFLIKLNIFFFFWVNRYSYLTMALTFQFFHYLWHENNILVPPF